MLYVAAMAWIATAPEIRLPDVDMRPVAAFVSEQPSADAVARFRQIATEAEKMIETARLEVRARTMHVIGRLAEAKLDGWSIDCSAMIDTFSKNMTAGEKQRAKLSISIRNFMRLVQRKRLPGSNTLGTYADRLDKLLVGWLNDLEDYRHELKDLQKFMLREQVNAPVSRAIDAYSHAIERATGVRPNSLMSIDPEDYGAMAYVELPVRDDVRLDRVRKRQFTNAIHDEVAAVDEKLVGLVALRYVQAPA